MKISVVGIGPGNTDYILPIAQQTISTADVVIGYSYYFQFVEQWITSGVEKISKELSEEEERAKIAIEQARAGKKVAVIGSGDASIYSMASIVYQLASDQQDDLDIENDSGDIGIFGRRKQAWGSTWT